MRIMTIYNETILNAPPIKGKFTPKSKPPKINRMASSIHRKFFPQNFYIFKIKQFWTVRNNFVEA